MGILTLHYEATPAPLTDLLKPLMQEPVLAPFYLVGGTALALHVGHRISVDIALFAEHAFDVESVAELLSCNYRIHALETAKNTVRCEANNVKLDIMSHRYAMIDDPLVVDGIRLAGLKDIAAMKLNAIANRGSKKDFWDFAELLNYFTRGEMLSFFAKKYTDENVWYVEKSLSYFEDAENEPDPRDLKGQTWPEIKRAIISSNKI